MIDSLKHNILANPGLKPGDFTETEVSKASCLLECLDKRHPLQAASLDESHVDFPAAGGMCGKHTNVPAADGPFGYR